MKNEERRPAMHGEAVLDDKTLYGVAHRKRRQDEKMREGFSLSSAPRGGKIALFAFLIFTFSLLICTCAKESSYEMVNVPEGSFLMGDTAGGGKDDEKPVHVVTLSAFSIGKYEVTQSLYESVMGYNPSEFKTKVDNSSKLPIDNVTWYDAAEFCNKLSEKEKLQPVYAISGREPATGHPITSAVVTADWSKNGYRLPTEAQWEYTAKGGNDSPGNFMYAGSNNIDDVAWHFDNGGYAPHVVGTKAPNGLGIYDMSGNVWEWCWDEWGRYSSDAQINPTGESMVGYYVIRGGSWLQDAENVRSARRSLKKPGELDKYTGLRLVRPSSAKAAKPKEAKAKDADRPSSAKTAEAKDPMADWVTREEDVWVEDGIIYARGSAKMSSMSMSMTTAETRARTNLSRALASNAISGYAPLSADSENTTTFNVNGVSGTFGNTTAKARFIADDQTVFSLISCNGAEVQINN